MTAKLHGLVAATHTPFSADGQLNLSVVDKQAAHLSAAGVASVLIAGSTGESHSLTVEERPPRLPNARLTPTRQQELRAGLENIGFFDWVRGDRTPS